MKLRQANYVALVALACLYATTAAAVKPAPGVYTIAFDDSELVYRLAKGPPDLDVAGVECTRIGGATDGHISAECTIEIDQAGVEGELEGTIDTEVFRTEGGDTKVKFKAVFDGELDVDGDDFDADFVMKGSGKVTPGNPLVTFDVDLEICLDDFCLDESQQITVALNSGDGAWTLALTIVEKEGEKIRGEAVVSFGDGKTVRFDAKGAHDPETGMSKVVLRPRNGKPGLKIKLKQLEAQGDDLDGRLLYKLFGHKNSIDTLLGGVPTP